jgi:hypothetical protein
LNFVPPTPSIEVVDAGVYKVLSSVQFNKTGGGTDVVDMFPSINGTPVPNSATKLSINQNQEDIMTVEWFLSIPAGGFVSIVLYSPIANDIQALAASASLSVPAIPSVITTILRIA